MTIKLRFALVALLALLLSAPSAQAQSGDDRYTIMQPEPWLAPKYRSPRGAPERKASPSPAPQHRATVPPPILVPETGRLLPNMPALPGSRAETYQDRALRCAHQAGAYGDAAGDRTAYIGACINQ